MSLKGLQLIACETTETATFRMSSDVSKMGQTTHL